MKKRRISTLIVSMLSLGIFAGCGKDKGVTYTALYNYDAETLNYMDTNKSENADVFASLVDGLVETDKYGTIVPALAESWEQNGTKWTFKIRKGVKWVTYKGKEYADVTANDWVTSLKYAVLSDEMNYLIYMFIEGSQEYLNASTYASAASDYERVNTTFFKAFAKAHPGSYDAAKAAAVKYTALTAEPNDWSTKYGNYYTKSGDVYSKVTGDSAPAFAANQFYKQEPDAVLEWLDQTAKAEFDTKLAHDLDFNNVGVKAVDDYTLEYTTVSVQNYFVSALLHSAYYPANEKFIKKVGFDNFGTKLTNMLYCGPHILKTWDLESRVVLVKNKKYWDAEHVYIDKVVLLKYDTSFSDKYDYIRKLYEKGTIDGFSVSSKDTVGWEKYVTGEDGTGTIYNPANPNAYSRESEMGSGSSYLFFLNRNFDSYWLEAYPQFFKTTLTNEEIDISNAVLGGYPNVRKALLYGLDRTYTQEGNWDEGYPYIDQYLTNTYVPKEFAVDENGKDYFEHYVEYYTAHFTKADDSHYSATEAAARLQPGTDGITDQALAAKYFGLAAAELEADGYTLPIKLEYAGLPDTDSVRYDTVMLRKWNEDIAAACATAGVDTVVEIVRNSAITTQQQYLYTSNYAADSIVVMGWGPDYADPLTYLDTLTSPYGAFASWAGYDNDEIYPDADPLLVAFNDLVADADSESDFSARFAKFAEAEFFAVYEEAVVIPYYIPGRGPRVQVSNIVPYEAMKGSIGAIDKKYKHMHVRKEAITQEERNALKEAYEAGKNKSN